MGREWWRVIWKYSVLPVQFFHKLTHALKIKPTFFWFKKPTHSSVLEAVETSSWSFLVSCDLQLTRAIHPRNTWVLTASLWGSFSGWFRAQKLTLLPQDGTLVVPSIPQHFLGDQADTRPWLDLHLHWLLPCSIFCPHCLTHFSWTPFLLNNLLLGNLT